MLLALRGTVLHVLHLQQFTTTSSFSHLQTSALPSPRGASYTSHEMSRIKCISLNVNGLQAKPKRKAIFELVRRGGHDVICLQETHCTSAMEKIWQSEWGGRIWFSNGRSNAREVAILLRKEAEFTVIGQASDDEGRLLILQISNKQSQYTIVNAYAPTQDRPEDQVNFVDLLEDQIVMLEPRNILIGGDLNLCATQDLDRNKQLVSPFTTVGVRYRARIKALHLFGESTPL